MARRKKSSVQAITPEEPTVRKKGAPESPSANSKQEHSPLESPSTQDTRELELAILDTLRALESGKAPNVPKLISVLNHSLTAISHWSLQAQLAQLENRAAWDSRLAVENSLIKKEVEFFRNRCMNESRRNSSGDDGSARLLEPAELPSLMSSSSASRVTKPPRNNPNKKSGPLRLVENEKPHPRLRRRSDNPSASDFVRVFHLEKS